MRSPCSGGSPARSWCSVPEARDGARGSDFTGQLDWERINRGRADEILYWVPRAMDTLPGLSTNVEFPIKLAC